MKRKKIRSESKNLGGRLACVSVHGTRYRSRRTVVIRDSRRLKVRRPPFSWRRKAKRSWLASLFSAGDADFNSGVEVRALALTTTGEDSNTAVGTAAMCSTPAAF